MTNRYREIKLGSQIINQFSKPYIIAEIGVNHEGSLERAKKLIELSKAGGANAAKFQTYKADTIASKNSPSYWDTEAEPTKSQHELFKKYDGFGLDDYSKLAQHCRENKIDFLSTPFDLDAVDFLDPMMPFFKIASADITNIPLLRKVASKKKPIVLSTGASRIDEIGMAVELLKEGGIKDLILLHCVLNYPTPSKNAHIRMIKGLKRNFPDLLIGYSDHTHPDEAMTSLVAAHMLGAVIIEKHFTDDKTAKGNDHYHAMDIDDLKNYKSTLNIIHEKLGQDEIKYPLESEKISRNNARRSIYTKGKVNAGEILSENNLICKRPGTGISPLFWDQIIGKKMRVNIDDDEQIQWSHLT